MGDFIPKLFRYLTVTLFQSICVFQLWGTFQPFFPLLMLPYSSLFLIFWIWPFIFPSIFICPFYNLFPYLKNKLLFLFLFSTNNLLFGWSYVQVLIAIFSFFYHVISILDVTFVILHAIFTLQYSLLHSIV